MVIQHVLISFYNEQPMGCVTQLAARLYKPHMKSRSRDAVLERLSLEKISKGLGLLVSVSNKNQRSLSRA